MNAASSLRFASSSGLVGALGRLGFIAACCARRRLFLWFVAAVETLMATHVPSDACAFSKTQNRPKCFSLVAPGRANGMSCKHIEPSHFKSQPSTAIPAREAFSMIFCLEMAHCKAINYRAITYLSVTISSAVHDFYYRSLSLRLSSLRRHLGLRIDKLPSLVAKLVPGASGLDHPRVIAEWAILPSPGVHPPQFEFLPAPFLPTPWPSFLHLVSQLPAPSNYM